MSPVRGPRFLIPNRDHSMPHTHPEPPAPHANGYRFHVRLALRNRLNPVAWAARPCTDKNNPVDRIRPSKKRSGLTLSLFVSFVALRG